MRRLASRNQRPPRDGATATATPRVQGLMRALPRRAALCGGRVRRTVPQLHVQVFSRVAHAAAAELGGALGQRPDLVQQLQRLLARLRRGARRARQRVARRACVSRARAAQRQRATQKSATRARARRTSVPCHAVRNAAQSGARAPRRAAMCAGNGCPPRSACGAAGAPHNRASRARAAHARPAAPRARPACARTAAPRIARAGRTSISRQLSRRRPSSAQSSSSTL